MAIAKLKSKGVDIHLWAPVHEVESAALDQLKNVASLPWVAHVAVMPDVHVGKGATVGSVIGMRGAVSPATVGVDIGCGMGAIRTSMKASDLPDNLEALRAEIEARIPVGFNGHDDPAFKSGVPEAIKREGERLFSEFRGLCPEAQNMQKGHNGPSLFGTAKKQVGTLGGGNHFIEVCLDQGGVCPGEYIGNGVYEVCDEGMLRDGPWGSNAECGECDGTGKVDPRVWLMLHSGSRNVGKTLAEIHIAKAQTLIHNQRLPDRDLAVFLSGTPEMAAYRNDLFWAQQYAFFNRLVMFELFKEAVKDVVGEFEYNPAILCHHNYVAEEMHFGEELIVTRKGAINASRGQMGIIPGSMGTKSYIVQGLGNPESLSSASHGAGRRMSRGAAKKNFTLADLEAQTAGVCCRKDQGILDEIPGSYKSIEQVMANQADLVQIKHELKQVLCVKG